MRRIVVCIGECNGKNCLHANICAVGDIVAEPEDYSNLFDWAGAQKSGKCFVCGEKSDNLLKHMSYCYWRMCFGGGDGQKQKIQRKTKGA